MLTPTFPLKKRLLLLQSYKSFPSLSLHNHTRNQHLNFNKTASITHESTKSTSQNPNHLRSTMIRGTVFKTFGPARSESHSESLSYHPNWSDPNWSDQDPNWSDQDNKVENHVPSVLHDPPPQNLLSSISSTITQQSQGGKPCHQQGLRQPSGILVPTTTFKHKHQNNKILPACLSDPAAVRLTIWP